MTRTSKVTQGAKYAGFGAVLVTALAISWWSMATMAMNDFGLPNWLAYAVSTAYDGAAIFVAVIAMEYSKTEDSGLMARMITAGFIGLSAWLNLQHAQMMDLNLAGQVFYAAPAISAGLLFEVMLRFENRQQLRDNGRIAKRLPPLGKVAWMRYPKLSFETLSRVVRTRIDSVSDTNETEKTPYDKKDINLANKDMSITKLVQKMYLDGETDKTVIRNAVSKIKGVDVPLGTVSKSIARMKK